MNKKSLLILGIVGLSIFCFMLGYLTRLPENKSDIAWRYDQQIFAINPNCTIAGGADESNNFVQNVSHNGYKFVQIDSKDFLWLVDYYKPSVIYCDGYTFKGFLIYYFEVSGVYEYVSI